MISTTNVPRSIASVVLSKLATLDQLQTVYGVEGMYDLIEVAAVDVHNRNIAMKRQGS